MIVDLFAGPGGWSEGLRLIGLEDVGLEWDADTCRTRIAAGHRTIRADVSRYPPDAFGDVEGLIASPPCTAFSMAGKGAGREEVHHLHEAVEACRDGWTAPDREWLDETTPLVLEPLRWAWELRPEWIACEQVPPVLPLWEHMADVLRDWGYDARAVKSHAEQFGVPQTRTRAFLLAHRDGVRLPKPTHQRYRHGEAAGEAQECQPGLFGPGLRPWVSMAEALGWVRPVSLDRRQNGAPVIPDVRERPCLSVTVAAMGRGVWSLRACDNTSRTGTYYERPPTHPSPTVRENTNRWKLRAGTHENDVARNGGEPAATVRFGGRLNAVEWVRTSFGKPHRGKEAGSPKPEFDPWGRPCRAVNTKTGDWVRTRPATTVQADPLLGRPGHKDWSPGGESMFEEDAVRIQAHEAAILQGFCPLYPWQGSKTSRFSQIGNAVCPPWAAAIIGALTGRNA